MTQQHHEDQTIDSILQSAFSANKGLRWRRKQLGFVNTDVKSQGFRQCLLSDFFSLEESLCAMATYSHAPNLHGK
jgi:hypothetical protein